MSKALRLSDSEDEVTIQISAPCTVIITYEDGTSEHVTIDDAANVVREFQE
ncbi:hypothetical protein [Alteromonas sp. RKMC-009]|uniref:hypothetical protein n=1 Tax=Alteromonas sp. RKMC-009 TaxID=2267264 RepID=UPI0013762893|nr:hypothetical protein [Alteromonas sp. RKMC-009]